MKQKWRSVLKQLEVDDKASPVLPSDKGSIHQFEEEFGVKLPRSYRDYCMVFGAGEIGWEFRVSVPGFKGEQTTNLDLKHHNDGARNMDYEEYSPDPQQHERSIFFAYDHGGARYFFDPEDITDQSQPEYAIYVLFRDWEVQRVTETFWAFVNEFCLGMRRSMLMTTEDLPPQLFRPFASG